VSEVSLVCSMRGARKRRRCGDTHTLTHAHFGSISFPTTQRESRTAGGECTRRTQPQRTATAPAHSHLWFIAFHPAMGQANVASESRARTSFASSHSIGSLVWYGTGAINTYLCAETAHFLLVLQQNEGGDVGSLPHCHHSTLPITTLSFFQHLINS
jgi:hypothetical protein